MAPNSSRSPLAAWTLDYQDISSKTSNRAIEASDALIGYSDAKSVSKTDKNKKELERRVDTSSIQVSKAWDAAISPAKAIPMNAMMLYMSGNSVQIFSMMVVWMMVSNPIKGILSMDQMFAPYRSSKHSLAPQMFVFLGCQALCIALGLYKCWSMGLLPTESSDWLAWRKAPGPIELSATSA